MNSNRDAFFASNDAKGGDGHSRYNRARTGVMAIKKRMDTYRKRQAVVRRKRREFIQLMANADMSPLGPLKIAYADSVSCPHGGVLVKVFN